MTRTKTYRPARIEGTAGCEVLIVLRFLQTQGIFQKNSYRKTCTLTGQQGSKGLQDGADAERRRPLLLQDVQADVTVLVDVGVKARRLERNKRRLVRVRVRKHQLQLVRQPLVLAVSIMYPLSLFFHCVSGHTTRGSGSTEHERKRGGRGSLGGYIR